MCLAGLRKKSPSKMVGLNSLRVRSALSLGQLEANQAYMIAASSMAIYTKKEAKGRDSFGR